MIISVHIPKCGGASFRNLLQSHFGVNFVPDHNDKPVNKSLEQRIKEAEKFRFNFNIESYIGISCIHGHFIPYKYGSLTENPDVKFVTWLREPIERIASHYYYWKRTENTGNEKNFGELRKKVKAEKWSLEKFCFSEELRNIYSSFFFKFPIDNFVFIGITEYFDTEIRYFAEEYLNIEIDEIPRKNINNTKNHSYFSDFQLVKELKNYHSQDYEIYEKAILKRQVRIENSAFNDAV